MGDLAALHAQARRLILALRNGLDRLEAQEGLPVGAANQALARDMRQKLADLQKTSMELDALQRMQAMSGGTGGQQLLWKRKVEQVAEEADHLRAALDRHNYRERRKQTEEAERAELLARRSGTNWQSEMEAEAAARRSVGNSRRVLDEAFQTGTAILGSMSDQRDRLKAAQRKALDVMNSVGLSDSLLRVIDRRHRADRWITYGGMTVVTLLLFGIWWWLGR